MSSRDIDSTSENVLHDWGAEEVSEETPGELEPEADELEPDADDSTPAWGTAAAEPVAEVAVETEVDELEELDLVEDVPEPEEAELDETPMQVELSHEHAAGDLHIPDGYAVLEGVAEGGRRAVGVVVSRFNGTVTTQLLESALGELAAAGVRQEAITIMVVPGAFELPLAATALAKTRRFACIVALGCVIRGDTPHFEYVSSEAASGLQLAALETGVPVAFGVLTLDRVEQAEARVSKGAEAVRSALEMADVFAHLRAAAAR
ncbi:MAG TPA: 6,7-dimethyl-8-ribityllumazine synthase [Gaiellaceae bacterium]|nr:6,7-dimethyl-8-ribityllumazine synthase [Gaiellaceae bacterium]